MYAMAFGEPSYSVSALESSGLRSFLNKVYHAHSFSLPSPIHF